MNGFLKQYYNIQDELSNNVKKGFDSEPVFTKNKIKATEGEINTNFNDDRMLKEGSHCICLSAILIDSVFKINKNYYPRVFLEEFKSINKVKNVSIFTDDDLEISSGKSEK